MTNLKLNKTTVASVFNRAIKGTHTASSDLTLALRYAVYFSIKDGNGVRGEQLYNEVNKRYQSDVLAYLLAFGQFTLCPDTKKPRMKKGYKLPDSKEAIDLHAKECMTKVLALPCIDTFKKEAKAVTPVTAKPLDVKKAISNSISRNKKLLADADLSLPENLHNQKIIAAFESYKENILNGIDADSAQGFAAKTEQGIKDQAVKDFQAELLKGVTPRAKAFLEQLLKQQSKVPVKTNVSENVKISRVS